MEKHFWKLCAFLIIVIALVLTLASCEGIFGGAGNTPGGNQGDDQPADITFFASDKTAYVVKSASESDAVSEAVSDITYAISSLGVGCEMTLDIQSAHDVEILVGNVSRDACKSAGEKLSEALSDGEVGYIITVSENKLVFLASRDDVVPIATDYFIKNYLKNNTLTLKEGHIYIGKMTEEELDAMNKEYLWATRWDDAEKTLGKDVVDAFKKLYNFYGDSVYKWMANLYDIEHGGFYYANSARDYEGFGPDIESTTQVFGLITKTGMLEGRRLMDALPESIRLQTLEFVYGLYDDEDGYFYHPQWGKNIGSSRKGRDINSALGVIANLGGEIPENHALIRLESGKVESAVSKVIEKNAAKPASFLSSESELLNWLNGLNINNDSHGAGHTIESVSSQIKAAGYGNLVLDWLDSKQCENGLWQEVDPKNPYMALSGLLKIGSAYSKFGGQMKNCNGMIDTAIDVIMSDVDPFIVIYVYNPWGGLKYALLNMISANKAAREAGYPEPYDYDAAYGRVCEKFPDMVDVTIDKLSKFRKDDGSFSYYQGVSAAYTQGTLVSLGKNEGDVNGTSLGMITMYTTMFEILNYPEVQMYPGSAFDEFVDILTSLEVQDKLPKPEFETIDFELGEIPVYISQYATATGSSVEVVDDLDNDLAATKALLINSPAGIGNQITFKADGITEGMESFSFDFDIKIKKGGATSHQISLLTPSGGIAYMMTVHVSGNTVSFRDTTSNTHSANAYYYSETASVGEWIHLRIEYHVVDDGVVSVLYVNGKYAGESTNFYGRYNPDGSENEAVTPAISIERLQIYAMMGPECEFLLDNLDYEFYPTSTYEK